MPSQSSTQTTIIEKRPTRLKPPSLFPIIQQQPTTISMPRIRSILHAATAITSTIVFGNISEICDATSLCRQSMRYIIIIIFEILSTITSILCMLGCGCKLWKFSEFEWILSIGVAILHAISAALISSVRTGLGNIISVSFSWIGLFIAGITALLAITTENGPYSTFFHDESSKVMNGGAPEATFLYTFNNNRTSSSINVRPFPHVVDDVTTVERVTVPHHFDPAYNNSNSIRHENQRQIFDEPISPEIQDASSN